MYINTKHTDTQTNKQKYLDPEPTLKCTKQNTLTGRELRERSQPIVKILLFVFRVNTMYCHYSTGGD